MSYGFCIAQEIKFQKFNRYPLLYLSITANTVNLKIYMTNKNENGSLKFKLPFSHKYINDNKNRLFSFQDIMSCQFSFIESSLVIT